MKTVQQSAVMGLVVLVLAQVASATPNVTNTWKRNVSGSWSDPSKWSDVSGDSVPDVANGTNEIAYFVQQAGQTITLTNAVTIGQLSEKHEEDP